MDHANGPDDVDLEIFAEGFWLEAAEGAKGEAAGSIDKPIDGIGEWGEVEIILGCVVGEVMDAGEVGGFGLTSAEEPKLVSFGDQLPCDFSTDAFATADNDKMFRLHVGEHDEDQLVGRGIGAFEGEWRRQGEDRVPSRQGHGGK